MKEKVTKIISKIINSVWFVIIIAIIILGKTLLFYNKTVGEVELETILNTVSFIVVLGAILCTLPNKARVVGAIISDIVISILLFADHTYYIYARTILSVAQITNLQYGEEITKAIPILLSPVHILYFVDLLMLIALHYVKEIKIEKFRCSYRTS